MTTDKTIDDAYNATYNALSAAQNYLCEQGFTTRLFTNIDGEATLAIEAVDNDGETTELVAVFERV